MRYDADIREAAERDGTFEACLRDSQIAIISRDPEHDLCFAMVKAGLPDGEIQFWRGATPSLRYRSVHRTAGYRIGLGEDFPYRRAKRSEVTRETFSKPGDVFARTVETALAGVRIPADDEPACARDPQAIGEAA
jgi:hypothetical protein